MYGALRNIRDDETERQVLQDVWKQKRGDGMSDTISRQAATDHLRSIIDATDTKDRYNEGFADGLEFCISHMATMPPTQLEIIQCKDCKHYNKHKGDYMCGLNVLAYVRENDFCSKAERNKDA